MRYAKEAAMNAVWFIGSAATLYLPVTWSTFWFQDTFILGR